MQAATRNKINKLYKWMQKYESTHPIPPSIREMCQYMEVHESSICGYLKHMERMGLIYPRVKKMSRSARTIMDINNHEIAINIHRLIMGGSTGDVLVKKIEGELDKYFPTISPASY